MDDHDWILGFDIGGTKTAAVAGSRDGRILERVAFASRPERGFDAMWRDLVSAGQQIVATHGRPAAIGVSVGGPLDSTRGVIYSPPNLPGWDEIPLKDLLTGVFEVPTFVEHDAKACALAEWTFGAARGCRNVIFLTFGTGMGAALILDGRLYRGATDLAGDVGHWRIAEDGPLIYGKRGSWEGYASGAGVAALARELFPDQFSPDITAAEVVARARGDDPAARKVIELSAHYLGRGLALLIDLLNPEIIVLGSLAIRAGDLFLPIALDVVATEAKSDNVRACRIVPGALGERLGDVAAICAALYQGNLWRTSAE